MASVKGIFGEVVGRFFLTESTVREVRVLGDSFRELVVQSEVLKAQRFAVGDKAQVLVPGPEMRTYTPYGFDAALGTLRFLVYVHGDTPGSAWGRTVKVGDVVRFMAQGSLPLEGLSGPAVVFGDETSFAVAHSLSRSRPRVRAVFEVSSRAASMPALEALGLEGASLVEKGPGHLEAVAQAVRSALAADLGATLVLTGQGPSIQALRAALKSNAVPHAGQKVKAYWSPGKRGLD